MSEDNAAQQRLKKHNPFVVNLFDRKGLRRDNFLFFDGQSKLVTLPMADFDGYPLENEYHFFLLAILLVALGTVLPVVPMLFPNASGTIGYLLAAYLLAAGGLAVWVTFHLVGLRNAYSSASRDIHSTDFASRANGVRSLTHTFKSIVRWRRFMRYTMTVGLAALVLAAFAGFFLRPGGAKLEFLQALLSSGLFAISAATFWLLQIGRKQLTEGMDPTLALVHMVEEIGGLLLAARQTNLVGNGEN